MNYEVDSQKNYHILNQINDSQINQEFFYFLSPFEDLLLNLVYTTGHEDSHDKLKHQKQYSHLMAKKYGYPKHASYKQIFGFGVFYYYFINMLLQYSFYH